MISTSPRAIALSLALLALPAGLAAQESPAAPTAAPAVETDSATSARLQGWVMEMQQLDARLLELQQQALADPEISAEQTALGQRIQQAMFETDSTLEASMARVEQLQSEAAAAEAQADTARLVELGTEVQQIQAQFVEAQQLALARPDISADLQTLQARVEAKMLEMEPEVPQLIARFMELREQLSAALQSGG